MFGRCQVYAYVHVDGELAITLKRRMMMPCVPFVGMVLEGNHTSQTVDHVAWNYAEGSFVLMTEADACEVDGLNERVRELENDGFAVRVDYRETGDSQTKGRNDGEA